MRAGAVKIHVSFLSSTPLLLSPLVGTVSTMSSLGSFGVPLSSTTLMPLRVTPLVFVTTYVQTTLEPAWSTTGCVGSFASSAVVGLFGSTALIALTMWIPPTTWPV